MLTAGFFIVRTSAQRATVRTGPLTIVIQDLASDAPVPAVLVSVVDRDGRVLATGLTDADGRFSQQVKLDEAFAIRFEKVGYVRRPEIVSVQTSAEVGLRRGRLLRSNGDQAYYQRAGAAIEVLAKGSLLPAFTIDEEIDRADGLPAESRVGQVF